MRLTASTRRVLLSAGLPAALACSGATEPSDRVPGSPGIRFVAGDAVTDTVLALQPQALVAEVRDPDGYLVRGVVVRFEAALSASGGFSRIETFVGRLDQQQLGSFAVDTTDAVGQASALVRLGTMAGVARVVVTVPAYGFADTAVFTVRPGNAAQITVKVRDTIAIVGNGYALGAVSADMLGNPRPADVVTYTPTSNVVSVDAAGVVNGVAIGRAAIVIAAGTLRDTARTSVVPDGTFAAVTWEGNARAISTIRLDGSQRTRITSVASDFVLPRWNPAGTRIAFYEADPGINSRIHGVDLQGNRTQLVTTAPEPRTQFRPRYSADAQWLYFNGFQTGSYQEAAWRSRVDGSGLERIAWSPDTSFSNPSPSPDGTRVVVSASGVIATIDLATGALTSLGVQGRFPDYSPDGSRILFLVKFGYFDWQLAIVNADGTNLRVLANQGYADPEYSTPSWSPDGKFILVGSAGDGGSRLDLVNAATLEVIPLRTMRLATQPSFKP